MSGERPSPLWPEGLRKERNLPPVESQGIQSPARSDIPSVPKQEAGSGIKKPEIQSRVQNEVSGHLGNSAERQGSQESNIILPSYLDSAQRHFAAEWIQPKKEVLHGWDNFAELAFDMANLLSKPDNAAIPEHDIDAYDYEEEVGKHLPADE
jgi:hypothetical protein